MRSGESQAARSNVAAGTRRPGGSARAGSSGGAPPNLILQLMAVEEKRAAKPVRLRDGTLGYRVGFPRDDDCFAAAVATTLQVPLDQVPDVRIDERLRAGESPENVKRLLWEA